MTTKLTLSIDESVIVVAKKYAQQNGKSLSHIVENYLMSLTADEIRLDEISEDVKKLKGLIQLPEDFDYKTSISDQLTKKYQ